jgi:hypothetical protein
MLAHYETRRPFTFHLSNRVVEGIIRDVLSNKEANDAENDRALSIFQKSNQDDDEIAGYVTEVKNVKQFLLSLGVVRNTHTCPVHSIALLSSEMELNNS